MPVLPLSDADEDQASQDHPEDRAEDDHNLGQPGAERPSESCADRALKRADTCCSKTCWYSAVTCVIGLLCAVAYGFSGHIQQMEAMSLAHKHPDVTVIKMKRPTLDKFFCKSKLTSSLFGPLLCTGDEHSFSLEIGRAVPKSLSAHSAVDKKKNGCATWVTRQCGVFKLHGRAALGRVAAATLTDLPALVRSETGVNLEITKEEMHANPAQSLRARNCIGQHRSLEKTKAPTLRSFVECLRPDLTDWLVHCAGADALKCP
jgi:hypothetical protein